MPVMDNRTVRNMPDLGSGWIVARSVTVKNGEVVVNGDSHIYPNREKYVKIQITRWGEEFGA
ncbi:MAG TPA: hypothetical protein VEP90_10350, partial [Methylomirabilota bacterium]|nr:hypothetical protein [Methylomirabilota bacterium]